ncbi:MAG: hypothetical protein ACM31G_07180 [Flavobacteriales bacterium]
MKDKNNIDKVDEPKASQIKSEVELVCIFESDNPTCDCEFKHCLKKGY